MAEPLVDAIGKLLDEMVLLTFESDKDGTLRRFVQLMVVEREGRKLEVLCPEDSFRAFLADEVAAPATVVFEVKGDQRCGASKDDFAFVQETFCTRFQEMGEELLAAVRKG